ncbi:putative Tetratricopeptide repeat-like superfamily protein [Cinnamomum micranthum f. kanehirae]|uniref:Putative Tetratricopeptide repeat-like superfamily protein n=1 Tax=Cinnamomum micranthum f. kanehirae TaxID=337451 RepID=A0A443NR91_9MAGN|nr:putative Tetratricopeptide repeat-like superfamily protein [Cinnamomum micranthum f. kanehirae]
MEALLLRTGSASIHSSLLHGSPIGFLSDQDSGAGIYFSGRSSTPSPRSALHFEIKAKKHSPPSFRRSLSDTDLIRSKIASPEFRFSNRASFRSAPEKITEEEDDLTDQIRIHFDSQIEAYQDERNLKLKLNHSDLDVSDRVAEVLPGNKVLVEELEVSGGGRGKGRKAGGGNGGGRGDDGNEDQNKIGAYYQQMLKANPANPLLLRNYGKFLHEVERDYVRAEEYYGRAILASPADGEVLSLYGKLIWETQSDQERAKGYFDQAIKACPEDCYVLGSYAHFLWAADDDDEDENQEEAKTPPPLVEAR